MDQMNQPTTGAGGQQGWQAPSGGAPAPTPAGLNQSSVYLWVVIIAGLVTAAGLWWYYEDTNIELDRAADEMSQRYQNAGRPAAADADSAAIIEADLQAIDLDGLDQELESIGAELSQ